MREEAEPTSWRDVMMKPGAELETQMNEHLHGSRVTSLHRI